MRQNSQIRKIELARVVEQDQSWHELGVVGWLNHVEWSIARSFSGRPIATCLWARLGKLHSQWDRKTAAYQSFLILGASPLLPTRTSLHSIEVACTQAKILVSEPVVLQPEDRVKDHDHPVHYHRSPDGWRHQFRSQSVFPWESVTASTLGKKHQFEY